MTNANLFQANLSESSLRNVNLSNSNLFLANLKDADLCFANLTNVKLDQADLTGSVLIGAIVNEKWFNEITQLKVVGEQTIREDYIIEYDKVDNLFRLILINPILRRKYRYQHKQIF
ncbi:MAG: pentapeptide repeat-containing protein [Saprospiraceae bacterium]|nr:pentapeptide repeat-containing protein [Saprospiraceae bacterium]